MPLKTSLSESPKIDLTPMIDVVFLLIVFFMVGAKFTEIERKIELRVPTVTDNPTLTAAPRKRIVNVLRTGEIDFDGKPVTVEGLTKQLAEAKREYPSLSVVVRGDGQGVYQNVADVLNACRRAGVADMAIAVRLTEGRR